MRVAVFVDAGYVYRTGFCADPLAETKSPKFIGIDGKPRNKLHAGLFDISKKVVADYWYDGLPNNRRTPRPMARTAAYLLV